MTAALVSGIFLSFRCLLRKKECSVMLLSILISVSIFLLAYAIIFFHRKAIIKLIS
jgi:hypothetical protein